MGTLKRTCLALGFAAFGLARGQATPPPQGPGLPMPPAAQEERPEDVPDAEKLRRSTEWLARMRGVLQDVLVKLEEARSTKDVIKLNCVNEKLTQVKGLLRISEQADISLQEHVAKHETSMAEHEYTKVFIARKRVVKLRQDAEQCIGQLAFRTDENLTVEVETPEGLAGDDITRPSQLAIVSVRPPPASPTL